MADTNHQALIKYKHMKLNTEKTSVENTFNKTVVVIHAHPGDTEAFCAGTLKLLSDKGFRIIIATMTPGGMEGINTTLEETRKIRQEESKVSASILGAELYCLGQKDGFLFDSEEVRLQTIELLRKVKAGVVFTHLPNDYHIDKRTTSQIVETASMLSTYPNIPCKEKPLEITPLLYHTSTFNFSDHLGNPIIPPHFFVDITSSIDTKMAMLTKHNSQQILKRAMHKIENYHEMIEELGEELGERIGAKHAEVFWQHLGGGFLKNPFVQDELSEYVVFHKIDDLFA
ncbi:MAG: hypothetical protein CSA05_03515 [Bacteroidia bacterium]|nr:MAG: hypothetical protein CSB01_02000 [Bacteroidia bacterium]PIE85863.1 MAG: hypothetical protein CSA05_03515 [Bacteroidia bacterium]